MSLEALKCAINELPGTYSVITNNKIDINNIEAYNPNFEEIIIRHKDDECVNPHSVNPMYLKLTEAEENQEVDII